MGSLFLHPTSTAQWHALVNEAEKQSTITLGEELESYLVFLLMRFIGKPEMAASVLALEFLRAVDAEGKHRTGLLQDLGDKCLLFSGLFPGRAKRRRVHISYFVNIGKNAYHTLAELDTEQYTALFTALSTKFVPLMDVLQAMRKDAEVMLPLEAAELWRETQSKHALKAIHNYTQGIVVLGGDTNLKH